MHRTLLRALSIAVISTIILTASSWITHAAPAVASDERSAFVLTVFPHDSADVGFSNSWGNRRSGGRRHSGTDIISPRGTEVLAVADGVISALGQARLSGYFIRIDHGDGWTTSYMHLNNDTYGTDNGEGGTWTAFFATLNEGDEVTAGQVIGYVGDSGNAEGTVPHTHFEIKYEGDKENPYHYLRAVFNRENRLGIPVGTPI
jgi:murein DD-endopeptidase MepM/ murein hydrolase activator NlpD